MRKSWIKLLCLFEVLVLVFSMIPVHSASAVAETSSGREILNFNSDWGFYRGDLTGAEAVDFDDAEFANVTLPHTMRLEQKHCNGANSTYQGIGWYRRYFTVDESNRGKIINIDFEGVMIDSEVYLNGEKICTRNGGYIGFSVDITDKVKFGETNVLAVRVSSVNNYDTPPGKPDSSLDFHYYGGIYRDVTLRITDPVHISDPLQAEKVAGGGVFLTYTNVSDTQATIGIKTHVINDGDTDADITVVTKLLDPEGDPVAQNETDVRHISAGADDSFEQSITVQDPSLWHPDHPDLYEVVSEVCIDGVPVDSITTKAGIRTIEFKADGFYINGEKLYLRGANRHQSYQNIGDAASNSMQVRDAIQMKENGFNAVRAAHYPQDPAFLSACDEVGLLVIECQPGWQQFTNTQTFWDRTIRDTREMIRRDRNHPSVILWETSLNETNYSDAWAREATGAAHEEYPGDQLYTAADYGLKGTYYDVCFKVQDTQWKDDPSQWVDYDPNMPFLTREWGDWEADSKATRKQGEAQMRLQTRTREEYVNGDGYSDWGGLDASERIGGHFLWSWNDYTRGLNGQTLGSGTVDIDRYEKYCYYWFQSMQPADNPIYGPMVFIAGTYSSTSSLSVDVYSNADSVRLYQNGILVDELLREEELKSVLNIASKGGSPIYTFQLAQFAAGELRAEAIVDGQIAATHVVRTPETAVRLEIEIRERGITPVADGSDLIPVYIKAVDANGTVVPDFNGTVNLVVSGEGELVGKDIPRIKVEQQKLESGIGFAFVRTTDTAGEITINAMSDGVMPGSAITRSVAYTGTFVAEGTHAAWEGGMEKLEGAYVVYENIAAGKSVTASSQQDDNGNTNFASNATDDDETTRWCAMGGDLPQWLRVDLGNAYAIAGFEILWENAELIYKYRIEVSNDGTNWTTAVDMTGNNAVNGVSDLQLVQTQGRYVRLTVTGINGGWASLFELRVIPAEGAEDAQPGPVIEDAAIKRIFASGETVAERGADMLRDGVTTIGTGWLSVSREFPQSVTVEFEKPQNLLGSRIYWEKDSSWYTYSIEVSSDGEQWTTALDSKTVGGQHYKPESFPANQENVKFVRLTIENIVAGGEYQVGAAEWILYGTAYEAPAYAYLSDLEWTSAQSAYTTVKKDTAAYGGQQSLNSENGVLTFEKGLGSDTPAEIIYHLNGAYERFESYVGINSAAAKNGGEIIFKVYGDGALLYESPVMMRDDNCEFVQVDIIGVDELKLEVIVNPDSTAYEAPYNAHANWADAKVYFAVEKPVDKTELQALYDANKDQANENYTGESWNAFQTALEQAKELLDREDVTQQEVDAAVEALSDAVAGLKEIDPEAIAAAQAAQASAEQAKTDANAARAAAEAAKMAADQAAASAAEDQSAAEAAKTAAGLALAQAEAAEAAAEKAETAAQEAARAAESSDTEAAREAAKSAASAAESAASANAVAQAAKDTALAAKAAQDAQASAEEVERMAALNLSKTIAVAELGEYTQVLMADASAETIARLSEKAAAERERILSAETVEAVAEALSAAKAELEAVAAWMCAAETFSDVDADAWYHEAVDYVLNEGMMTGNGDGTFTPGTALNRAMLVQILYNIAGRPEVVTDKSFSDVPEGVWYYNAVMWAAENGIVQGYGNGIFGAADNVTREQMVTILYRYAGEPDADGTLPFDDTDSISEWAVSAVVWAYRNEIVQGVGHNLFDPIGFTNRAAAAQIMMNYFRK